MRPDRLWLAGTVAFAWGAALAIILGAPIAVTAPLGLLLVLLPGFVWQRAVHPRPMPGLETFAAVAATAFGLLVATALLLNLLPMGLRSASWAVALALLATCGATVAWARGGARLPRRTCPWRLTGPQVVALAVGIAALLTAGTISIVSARTSAEERFTELSLVPRGSTQDPTSAVLFVTNREGVTVRYRLDYTTGSETLHRVMTLRDGSSYRSVEPVRMGAASATLYRDSSSTAYRRVWIARP